MPAALYLFLAMMLVLAVIPVAITITDVLECRKNGRRLVTSRRECEPRQSLSSRVATCAKEIVRVPAQLANVLTTPLYDLRPKHRTF